MMTGVTLRGNRACAELGSTTTCLGEAVKQDPTQEGSVYVSASSLFTHPIATTRIVGVTVSASVIIILNHSTRSVFIILNYSTVSPPTPILRLQALQRPLPALHLRLRRLKPTPILRLQALQRPLPALHLRLRRLKPTSILRLQALQRPLPALHLEGSLGIQGLPKEKVQSVCPRGCSFNHFGGQQPSAPAEREIDAIFKQQHHHHHNHHHHHLYL
jgi:hypothetical protein